MTILNALLVGCCIVIPFLKPDLKMSRRMIFVLCIVIPIVAFCDVPIGQYRIKYDSFEQRLHGQTINFKKPMEYLILEDRHIDHRLKEHIEIGRFLIRQDDRESSPETYKKYKTEEVPPNMTFTIVSSYWYMKDFFSATLSDNRHELVVMDEQGKFSVMLFMSFDDSNKPSLGKLEHPNNK